MKIYIEQITRVSDSKYRFHFITTDPDNSYDFDFKFERGKITVITSEPGFNKAINHVGDFPKYLFEFLSALDKLQGFEIPPWKEIERKLNERWKKAKKKTDN